MLRAAVAQEIVFRGFLLHQLSLLSPDSQIGRGIADFDRFDRFRSSELGARSSWPHLSRSSGHPFWLGIFSQWAKSMESDPGARSGRHLGDLFPLSGLVMRGSLVFAGMIHLNASPRGRAATDEGGHRELPLATVEPAVVAGLRRQRRGVPDVRQRDGAARGGSAPRTEDRRRRAFWRRSSGRHEARRPAIWLWPESDVLWGSAVDSERCVFEDEARRKSSFSPGVHGARGTQSRAMRALGRGDGRCAGLTGRLRGCLMFPILQRWEPLWLPWSWNTGNSGPASNGNHFSESTSKPSKRGFEGIGSSHLSSEHPLAILTRGRCGLAFDPRPTCTSWEGDCSKWTQMPTGQPTENRDCLMDGKRIRT
jgi:hypothetical protein